MGEKRKRLSVYLTKPEVKIVEMIAAANPDLSERMIVKMAITIGLGKVLEQLNSVLSKESNDSWSTIRSKRTNTRRYWERGLSPDRTKHITTQAAQPRHLWYRRISPLPIQHPHHQIQTARIRHSTREAIPYQQAKQEQSQHTLPQGDQWLR